MHCDLHYHAFHIYKTNKTTLWIINTAQCVDWADERLRALMEQKIIFHFSVYTGMTKTALLDGYIKKWVGEQTCSNISCPGDPHSPSALCSQYEWRQTHFQGRQKQDSNFQNSYKKMEMCAWEYIKFHPGGTQFWTRLFGGLRINSLD